MLTLPSLNRFMIQTRNEHITARLRRRRNDVHVFCVSNELYSGYRLNESVHAQDYLELSGIPQLRRYCQLVPAAAQFRFVAMFLEHRATAVLRSVRQWTLAGLDNVTAERAETLRQVLSTVEKVFYEVGNSDGIFSLANFIRRSSCETQTSKHFRRDLRNALM